MRKVFHVKEMESAESIVDNYSDMIRSARQKMQLEQNVFALKLAEKESLIHAIETGKHEPSISLAKKIEKLLGIKLVENIEAKSDSDVLKQFKQKPAPGAKLTLGDIITIKRRR